MTAEIISGNEIAQQLRSQLFTEIKSLAEKDIVPGLAVILVGNNPASRTYVKNKQKACEKLGIDSRLIVMEKSATEAELLQVIEKLNADPAIDGILVQLPLPSHIDETNVIEAISPSKDVDGFHPINIGRMMTGQDCFLPCTPFGIIKMLESIHYSLSGKHVVVVGRSNIVGKPMGQLCLSRDATVTYCHSKTPNLKEFTKQGDVVISAVGKTGLITRDHIKDGAVVIDVAMNRDENGKLCGDVVFEEVKEKASYITPVPGGVGPMTITMLLYNTVQSAKAKI
ncbi:methenyltetrahydrofolate cyclohydrolase /5,10-methylenetetrahydrofolate dehydrogenase (NADP+) [Bacillus oleivorans]|uniref:Bifunctional protein FolD n=1 Tax=Bacillus oleivorans TaxID=1448271 RepID=A0A285CLU4_9BACI|nr:bifunctional methylenetetrahydrofolate dehydrogenase/methenyltetrahydrofolate cyclohydrolase FolD [Bacillus oleivorans]SNX67973.1 methenyltetrahydrofolate cyclohydrolase /5,10-methylenetetrahydrofolate dehydrogenase (NADP+) [Bacillus oleivorans]